MIVPTGDAAVLYLAEQLGGLRALSEIESRILHRVIIRETGAFRRWTPEEDARLMKMHKERIRATEMAPMLNRSEMAIYTRIKDLKKAGRISRHG